MNEWIKQQKQLKKYQMWSSFTEIEIKAELVYLAIDTN